MWLMCWRFYNLKGEMEVVDNGKHNKCKQDLKYTTILECKVYHSRIGLAYFAGQLDNLHLRQSTEVVCIGLILTR